MPRWIWHLVVVLAAAALVGTGGAVYLIVSDRTSPIGVNEAIDRYRDEQDDLATSTTTAPVVGSLAPEGVYVYATDGEEHVSALGGSTHRYPSETTITITAIDCGQRQRWSPLDERWDDEELCTSDAGLVRRSLRIHHQFFGMSDDQTFSCPAGHLLVPARPVTGDSWSTDCVADAVHTTGTGEVVGFEARLVGADSVPTVHVRMIEDGTGSSVSHGQDDFWLRVSDGLLIERVSRVDSRSESPVGEVTYSEQYSLRLLSLVPRT